MDILEWIQEWFKSHCDGDWEHSYGVEITTVDNPGWYVTIDLEETGINLSEYDSGLIEHSENDWYFVSIKGNKFKASGDPSKLKFLLEEFKRIAEKTSSLP